MKNLRALLVDDERIARSRLRHMLEKEGGLELLEECADGASAVAAIRALAPDVVFLDISMPDMDGFAVLDALGPENQPGVVVFVTAEEEHAIRAFEACALDYLLKPASPERLKKALERVRARAAAHHARPAGEPPATPPGPARFTVRSGGQMCFVAPQEIDWIEAAGNYALFHAGPRHHMIRETMSALEAKLAPEHFLRVSRSAIVNLRRVKELRTVAGGEHAAVLPGEQRVPITRSLREVAEQLAALQPAAR